MSIAAGIPMPAVYVINDAAPNAFATGRDPQHASVAVTAGLLQMMSRDELQGVIAHEMSHVRNFDIRFATLVGVLVGMIALIADFFLRSTFFGGFGRRDSNNNGGAGAIFFLIAIVLAILAPFFALMVQMAISRHREYLADASGVELTRNPLGLAHALQKIAGDPRSLQVATRATAHLYIANPLKGKKTKESAGLFDTHPPIQKRIDILLAMAHAGPDALGAAARRRPPQGAPRASPRPGAPGTGLARRQSSRRAPAGSRRCRAPWPPPAGPPAGRRPRRPAEQAARQGEVGVVVGGSAAQELFELPRRALVPAEGVVRAAQRLADGVLVGRQAQGLLEEHGGLRGWRSARKRRPV